MKHSKFRAVVGTIITKVKPLNILRRQDCLIRCPQLSDHERNLPPSVDVLFTSLMEPLSHTAKRDGCPLHKLSEASPHLPLEWLYFAQRLHDLVLILVITFIPITSSFTHSLPCSPCHCHNPTSSPSLLSLPLTLFHFQWHIPTAPKEVQILQPHPAALPHALLIQPPPFHVFTRSHQQLSPSACLFIVPLPFTYKCTVIIPISQPTSPAALPCCSPPFHWEKHLPTPIWTHDSDELLCHASPALCPDSLVEFTTRSPVTFVYIKASSTLATTQCGFFITERGGLKNPGSDRFLNSQ